MNAELDALVADLSIETKAYVQREVAGLRAENLALRLKIAELEGRLAMWPQIALELDADGRPMIKCVHGATTSVVRVPCLIDRGVFREGTFYEKGDGVTHDRSFWLAQVDHPSGRPGSSKDWRLAVMRGRDGKEAT